MKHLNPEPAPISVRIILPGLLVLLANAFILVPTPDFVFGRVHVMLPFIFVFHWSIFRPEGVHWSIVIVLGVFIDLWSEAVVGLSSLMLIGFQNVVVSLRDDLFNLRFEWRWIAFCVLAALYVAIFGAINGGLFAMSGRHLDLVGRWLLCCAFYPLAIWAFVVLEQRVLYPRRRA